MDIPYIINMRHYCLTGLVAVLSLLIPYSPVLSAELRTSVFALNPKPKELPKIVFMNGHDQEIRLEDFKGKIVLLNIWATWCIPCRKEMPALDRLQKKLGSSDFTVVALSIDRDGLDAVRRFFKLFRLESLDIYNDIWDESTAALRIAGIPTTILIDRRGREIGRRLGPYEWDSDDVVKELQLYIESKITTRINDDILAGHSVGEKNE